MGILVNSTFVLSYGDVPAEQAEAVLDSALVARADVQLVELSGPGAVGCIQGIFTNDVERPGDGSFVYGAVLTPKGMIIADAWCLRGGDSIRLSTQAHTHARLLDVLRRSIPPRLAVITDQVPVEVLRVTGPRSLEVASRAGLVIPEPGRAEWGISGASKIRIARPAVHAPFSLEIQADADSADIILKALEKAGAQAGDEPALELGRVLVGWPRVDAEVAERTLPQEVRYDEIDGVSYTKGCYVGQETVARLHFRGHANRELVGLSWERRPQLESSIVSTTEGRELGRVTSAAWLDPIDLYVGLALVRKGTERGVPVLAGGTEAVVHDLPFRLDI